MGIWKWCISKIHWGAGVKRNNGILTVFFLCAVLAGCGGKEEVSLYGKEYYYDGEDFRITRTVIFSEEKCVFAMDAACVLQRRPLHLYADYEVSGDRVIATVNEDEVLVFELSGNTIIYRAEESQTSLSEAYLSEGMVLEGVDLPEEAMQATEEMMKLAEEAGKAN